MLVKLRVLEGPSAGRELPVNVAEFLVGRSEECQLRPKSDMVSRRHCAIVVGDDGVILRDFGSRNGTLINGERVEGEKALKPGDELRIGPLRFEVLIDHAIGGAKKPQAKSIQEVAQRTVDTKKKFDDSAVSDWLSEADDVDREHRLAAPETRQFRMDETDRLPVSTDKTVSPDGAPAADGDTKESQSPEKKAPGKLPPRPDDKTKNSRDAAALALRKLFKSQ